MSLTVDVITELLRWPIAPDGYIPNSVIRSWGRKEKAPTKIDYLDDIFYGFDECTTSDLELSARVIWFAQDEEEEEEKTDDVKRRRKEKEGEKHEEEKTDMERKEEDKMDRIILVKPSYNIQTTLQDQLKTFHVEPQRQEVSSTYSSRKPVNLLQTCHEKGHTQLREEREDMKLHETITPPLQYVAVPYKQRTSGFIPKEPRITLCKPPMETHNLTPHPLKPPPPTPEDLQPQPDLGPPECSPIRDVRVLLSSTTYYNVRDQAHVPLDRKVIEVYKKFKFSTKNSSHPGKRSTITERLLASKATHYNVQTNTGGLNLNGGLSSPLAFRSMLSTIQTQPSSIIDLECPSRTLCSDNHAQFAQTILPTNDQKGYKDMPEWRKNLYKCIALQGSCSPRAARLATREHLVKSSKARQLAATIPSLQPGQAAAHQRVVQKIQMQDPPEPASIQYHWVIPMNSQQSFYTLNPSGKTQYGRLQFDWMRGHEEDNMLSVCNIEQGYCS